MKKKVMNESWFFIREHKMNKSEALRQAWLVVKVREAMTHGCVEFEFMKTDNKTIRKALGTLHPNVIPAIKGTERKPNNSVQVFFDTEINEWRCFKKSNLIRATI